MVLTKDDVEDIVKLLLINNQKAVQGYVIASLYFKIGEYHTALKYVSKYLCIDPDSFVASKLQGECYEKLNRIDDALASYEKALNSADKKKDVKPSADNHNVDGIRDEMETIEILSPPVVGHEQGSSANIATVNVIAETIPTPPATSSALETETNTDGACSEITFEFRVTHITLLDCDDCSDKFVFRNLMWRVVVVPNRDRGVYRALSVYLICMGKCESSSQWSCHVDAEIRLLSVRSDQHPYVKKTRHLFKKESDAWGFSTFVSWYDAVRPDGNNMQDYCITVQVHLKALE